MLNILMLVALTTVNPVKTVAINDCAWPKVCKKTPVVAQVQPCVWPKCVKPQQELLAQVQPCVWPKCDKPELVTF